MATGTFRAGSGITFRGIGPCQDCQTCPVNKAERDKTKALLEDLPTDKDAADGAWRDYQAFVPSANIDANVNAVAEAYDASVDGIRDMEKRCRREGGAEEIIKAGEVIGIYCASQSTEIYFNEEG